MNVIAIVAIVIVGLTLVILAWRASRALGAVTLMVQEIVPVVHEVNRAVNGKEPGQPHMADQVQELIDQLPDGVLPLLQRVALAVGATKLDDPGSKA